MNSKKKNKWLLGLVFLLNTMILLSQTNSGNILPKGFAEGEERLMPEYIQSILNNPDRSSSTPPEGVIRTLAEWEELEGVVITWSGFPEILSQIVNAIQEECKVYIVCDNKFEVIEALVNNGVSISEKVAYIEGDFNSIWVRDYGPNSAYINNVDSLIFIDWIYNRPRYQDNVVPELVGDVLGIPVYITDKAPLDLVHTGGNFMADGLGMAFSSKLVLEENGPNNKFGQSNHSREEVDSILNLFMGIETNVLMEVLPYDAIHHIDMHMKLLDERTMIVGEYPEGVSDGPQIEANIQYVINNYEAAFGREFDIIRVPMPPDAFGKYPVNWGDYRTYANALIANKTVIVPTYEEEYDTTALRIWQEAMPGYNIVGIDCNEIIPLSGALHCITKEVGSREPIQISHAKLPDLKAEENTGDYKVEAILRHKSGINTALLMYTTDLDKDYSIVTMSLEDEEKDLWSAAIPKQANDTKVYYYFYVVANNGKEQVRPMPAPEGYFEFDILPGPPVGMEHSKISALHIKTIYPNPASAITVIPLESSVYQKNIRIELLNVLGKTVDVLYEGDLSAGQKNFFLMAHQYPKGVYAVQIITADGTIGEMVVID